MGFRNRGLPKTRLSLTERIAQENRDRLEREEAKKRTIQSQKVTGGAVVDDDGQIVTDADNKPIKDEDASLFTAIRVAQIANKPDDPSNYGQGPAGSTRLCSHKFVLDQPLFSLYGTSVGYILVRFHKNGKRGPDWVYGPVSIDVYKAFAASNSKGRFINTTLNGYGYRPASETPYADQFNDFAENSGTDSAGIRL